MSGPEGIGREPAGDDPWTRLRENATGIVSLLVTAIWMGAMFTGQDWWLAALLVGYIAVVPVVAILFGDEDDIEEWADEFRSSAETERPESTTDTATDSRDALETLRERYAAGELSDEQFERKLERLLDTESLEDAREWTRERDRTGDGVPERDLEYDR
ncbi:SHOCT domain-containing protein [Natrinema sp. CGMCC1.2065]|uniref:SHOCT domain-containing protein n=1 Tax=Natrinema sp. CGMCC1.2065 TaxID=3445767 RepID=UPI003F49B912